jgi:hypothetical protein
VPAVGVETRTAWETGRGREAEVRGGYLTSICRRCCPVRSLGTRS